MLLAESTPPCPRTQAAALWREGREPLTMAGLAAVGGDQSLPSQELGEAGSWLRRVLSLGGTSLCLSFLTCETWVGKAATAHSTVA